MSLFHPTGCFCDNAKKGSVFLQIMLNRFRAYKLYSRVIEKYEIPFNLPTNI